MIPFLLVLLVLAVDPHGFEPPALKRALLLTAGPLALLMLLPTGGLRRVATTPLGFGLSALALLFAWSCLGTVIAGVPLAIGGKGVGLLLLLLAFAALARENATKNAFRLGDSLLALGLVCAVYAILQRIGFDPLFLNPEKKSVAFFGNTNRAAEFIAPLAPLALAFRTSRGGTLAGLATLALPLLVAATILTNSRAGAIAAGVGLLAVLVFTSDPLRRKVDVALIAAGLLLPLLLGGIENYRFKSVAESEASIVSPDYSPNRQRELLLEASLRMSKDSPLFGKGAGNFRYAFPRFRDPEEARMLTLGGALSSAEDPHNEFLLLATESGIPAAALFVIFLLSALLSVRTSSLWPAGHPLRAAAPGYAGALIALCVMAAFRSILDHAPVALMTAALGGSLLACREIDPASRRSGPLLVVLPIWLVAIAFLGVRALASEICLGLAARDLSASRLVPAIDDLSNARMFDGTNLAAMQLEATLTEGAARLDPKRTDAAIAARRRILALDPSHVTSHFRLAARMYERGDFGTARSHLRYGLSVLGENRKGWSEKGVTRLLEQKEFRAAAIFERLRRVGGEGTLGELRSEADTNAKSPQRDRQVFAAELLAQFLELRPADPDAAYDLAELCSKLEDKARADSYYERSHLCRAAQALEHKDVVLAKRSLASAQHYGESFDLSVLLSLVALLEKDSLPLEKLEHEARGQRVSRPIHEALAPLAKMPEFADALKRIGS